MKYLIGTCLIVFVCLASCKKKKESCSLQAGSTVAPATEETMVTNYLSANGITNATELNNSGLYYSITTPGVSEQIDQCSIIRVKYTGKFVNGTIFDQTTGDNVATFELGGLIEGWRRSIPLLGEGGKIKLYIPPSMGYGSSDRINPQTGQVIIPGNSVLIFDLELVTITN